MNKIKFETFDENEIEGNIISTVELNRIARRNCRGLTYLMNVMNADNTDVYMWFKDDQTGESYLVEIA